MLTKKETEIDIDTQYVATLYVPLHHVTVRPTVFSLSLSLSLFPFGDTRECVKRRLMSFQPTRRRRCRPAAEAESRRQPSSSSSPTSLLNMSSSPRGNGSGLWHRGPPVINPANDVRTVGRPGDKLRVCKHGQKDGKLYSGGQIKDPKFKSVSALSVHAAPSLTDARRISK